MSQQVSIVIADASSLICEGLIRILEESSGWICRIRHVIEFEELPRILTFLPPGLVIINPLLVQHNLRTHGRMKQDHEQWKWIALQTTLCDPLLLPSFDGVCNMYDPPATIMATLHYTLASGNSEQAKSLAETLSMREIAVLRLLAAGKSNKEIAEKLAISINTAITHRKNISQKTGIKTVSGLTLFAVAKGFIRVTL